MVKKAAHMQVSSLQLWKRKSDRKVNLETFNIILTMRLEREVFFSKRRKVINVSSLLLNVYQIQNVLKLLFLIYLFYTDYTGLRLSGTMQNIICIVFKLVESSVLFGCFLFFFCKLQTVKKLQSIQWRISHLQANR